MKFVILQTISLSNQKVQNLGNWVLTRGKKFSNQKDIKQNFETLNTFKILKRELFYFTKTSTNIQKQ